MSNLKNTLPSEVTSNEFGIGINNHLMEIELHAQKCQGSVLISVDEHNQEKLNDTEDMSDYYELGFNASYKLSVSDANKLVIENFVLTTTDYDLFIANDKKPQTYECTTGEQLPAELLAPMTVRASKIVQEAFMEIEQFIIDGMNGKLAPPLLKAG